MRDILVVFLLAGGVILTFYRPWLSVPVLAFFGYANPHRYAWGFSATLPVYQIVLACGFIALALSKERQPLPRDWRIVVFYMLWLWFLITTLASPLGEIAWTKLWEVSKVYIPLFLTLKLINTPKRLFWLLVTIALSFGLLAAKGGVFAIATGFSYRVWGPDGTMYGGNNEFAVATLMAIPLLLLAYRRLKYAPERWAKLLGQFCLFITPLAVASAISSWSRGALLALGALAVMVWWNSKHKVVVAAVIIAAVALSPAFLPHEWFERMQTIAAYEQDESAMGRIEVWRDGIRYVLSHPITAAGFDGWRLVTQRDWHSSYVEILSEHGFVGFAMWISLMIGSLLSLGRIARLTKRDPDLADEHDMAVMMRASMVAYMMGSLTLGITYWDLIYQLVFCSILLKAFVLQKIRAKNAARPGATQTDTALASYQVS